MTKANKVQTLTKKYESKFAKWIVDNKYRLITIALLLIFSLLIKDSFELRLFLDTKSIFGIVIILSLLILKIKPTLLFAVSILLFIPALAFILFDELHVAEVVGNTIYILFFTGIMRSIIGFREDKKE